MTFNFFSMIKPENIKDFMFETHKIQTTHVFDWDLAKKIIKEQNITIAYAGIREDWDATCDLIYENGDFVYNKAHLESKWGCPILKDDIGLEYSCFRIEYEPTDYYTE